MSRQNVSDKKEKSLAEIVIIVLMVAILMMVFIHYFFKQEEQLTKVGFNTLTQNFSTKITTIRAQWFMDKQPRVVNLVSSGTTQEIYINESGWVDSPKNELACRIIWNVVIAEPLTLMNMDINVKQVSVMNKNKGRVCRYSLATGESFDYNSSDGKVSRVSKINTSV